MFLCLDVLVDLSSSTVCNTELAVAQRAKDFGFTSRSKLEERKLLLQRHIEFYRIFWHFHLYNQITYENCQHGVSNFKPEGAKRAKRENFEKLKSIAVKKFCVSKKRSKYTKIRDS